jgi:mannose-6-phosphate isomerase-like protein (cupin superfamily)
MDKITLADKFALITEHFRPKVVAELNGQEVKLAKVRGEFVWHHHEVEDELFLVVRGSLRIEFRDRAVTLGPGEMLVVPHGVEHRPVADEETEILLFEPAATRNTGNLADHALTAPDGVRI